MKMNVLCWKTTAALFLGLAVTPAAQASGFETVNLRGSRLSLSAGETETVYLDGWRHVQKLFISAEGTYRDAMFEVIVNGDVKGTIYVPGRDPSYVVTVGEAAHSIQLRHISGSTVRIHNIKAVQSIYLGKGSHKGGALIGGANEVSALAAGIIDVVDQLEYSTTYEEFATNLLPIKKLAGRTYAVANGRGALARKTRDTVLALIAQIDLAETFTEELMSREATFDLAVSLMSFREELDDLLN